MVFIFDTTGLENTIAIMATETSTGWLETSFLAKMSCPYR